MFTLYVYRDGGQWFKTEVAWSLAATCVLLTPEIHHSADVEEREDDGEEDLQTRDEAREHEERRDEDARERQKDVPVQLVHNDLKQKESK